MRGNIRMCKLFFEGMYGLGDNIYQRPFLRHFPGAYVRTPWPELYCDLDIHCVRSKTKLHAQRKNEERTQYSFINLPDNVQRVRIGYSPADLQKYGVIGTFRKQFNINDPLEYDLPDFNDRYEGIPFEQRIAIIRPATLRREWESSARNPEPDYINRAAHILRQEGFFVISIADTEPDIEWIIGTPPAADLNLIHGELTLTQLCTLYKQAACVVSPVGFSIPMSIAYRTPLFVIGGGRGGHNAPEILTDPEMPLNKIKWALPDNYCRCTMAKHDCSKTIAHFDDKFYGWLNESVY